MLPWIWPPGRATSAEAGKIRSKRWQDHFPQTTHLTTVHSIRLTLAKTKDAEKTFTYVNTDIAKIHNKCDTIPLYIYVFTYELSLSIYPYLSLSLCLWHLPLLRKMSYAYKIKLTTETTERFMKISAVENHETAWQICSVQIELHFSGVLHCTHMFTTDRVSPSRLRLSITPQFTVTLFIFFCWNRQKRRIPPCRGDRCVW